MRLRVADDVPSKVSVIFGDVVHNLRSALDDLAWQLSLACGGEPNRSTAFPVFDEIPADLGAEIARRVPSASAEIVDTIRGLEPYRGGKGTKVWQIHQLNIIDKHRLLVKVGTCNVWINVRGLMPIQAF